MIVLAGASASGKTEVAKYLQIVYGITKIITTTTRPPRKGEVNGKDYFFVDVEIFKQMIKENKFVEYTIYNNNYYGSTKDQIAYDKCVVVDPIGLKSFMDLNDKSIVSFCLKCGEETRRKRMIFRGDKESDIEKRLVNDRQAFDHEKVSMANYIVDSEHQSLDSIVKEVIDLYNKHLGN